MLMEWLEPKITKRIEEVSAKTCEDKAIGKHMDEFADNMDLLQQVVSEEMYINVVMNMEAIMNIICSLSEDIMYREGLNDGMKIHQDMLKLTGYGQLLQ